jgi:hypothetical protein
MLLLCCCAAAHEILLLSRDGCFLSMDDAEAEVDGWMWIDVVAHNAITGCKKTPRAAPVRQKKLKKKCTGKLVVSRP